MSHRVSHGASDTQDVHNIRRVQERRSGVSARAPSGAVRFPPCRRPIKRRHRRRRRQNPGVLARKIQIPKRTFHATACLLSCPAIVENIYSTIAPMCTAPTVESYFRRKFTDDCGVRNSQRSGRFIEMHLSVEENEHTDVIRSEK